MLYQPMGLFFKAFAIIRKLTWLQRSHNHTIYTLPPIFTLPKYHIRHHSCLPHHMSYPHSRSNPKSANVLHVRADYPASLGSRVRFFLEYWSRPWPNDSGAERINHDCIVVVTSPTIVCPVVLGIGAKIRGIR